MIIKPHLSWRFIGITLLHSSPTSNILREYDKLEAVQTDKSTYIEIKQRYDIKYLHAYLRAKNYRINKLSSNRYAHNSTLSIPQKF